MKVCRAATPEAFVTLRVGQEAELFVTLKSVLCSRSEYFRAAFEGRFEEQTSRETSLPDVEAKHFGLILQWFYSGRILFSNGSDFLLPLRGPIRHPGIAESGFRFGCRRLHTDSTRDS